MKYYFVLVIEKNKETNNEIDSLLSKAKENIIKYINKISCTYRTLV